MLNEQNLTISVIGLGYIGLPTASFLASNGFMVYGTDTNKHVVDTINQGKTHIQEKDLDALLKSVIDNGQFKASLEIQPADIYIIAVPTPFDSQLQPDLTYIEQATLSLAKVISPGSLVILESTSPIGTTEKIGEWIYQARPDLKIDGYAKASDSEVICIAHCPERVLPGRILIELRKNNRIIGGITSRSARIAEKFYAQFVEGRIITTDGKTAELTKLVENAFRDVNIAFANELSIICDELDVNVWELINLANLHPRVDILAPGPGVGGHCIAVDPWFIVASSPHNARLIQLARQINDNKKGYVVKKVLEQAEQLTKPRIAILGLTYKADIDDLRESPALDIAHQLITQTNFEYLVVEPNINVLPELLHSSNCQHYEFNEAIELADIIVLLVDHKEFATIHGSCLRGKAVIDTKGVWEGLWF